MWKTIQNLNDTFNVRRDTSDWIPPIALFSARGGGVSLYLIKGG